jgi:hypothetical protein
MLYELTPPYIYNAYFPYLQTSALPEAAP